MTKELYESHNLVVRRVGEVQGGGLDSAALSQTKQSKGESTTSTMLE